MNYIKYLFLFFVLFSCTTPVVDNKKIVNNFTGEAFSNKGFALLYNPNLKKEKKISKILDNRSLIIFQKNLKKDTKVKVTNLINNKSILVTVGSSSIYPSFYNSVISQRIFNKLEIDKNEPYVEILEVLESSTFLAKKAKTFDEEKEVAEKAPVDGITIDNLGKEKKKEVKIKKNSSKIFC